MSRGVLVLVALLWCADAGAATADCAGAGDGTPCTTGCVPDGICDDGVCVGAAAADGTPCASGNRCTVGDTCLGGVCREGGAQVSCPSAGACHPGVCDAEIGCIVVSVCAPDLGAPPDLLPPADLLSTTSGPDLGPAPDLAPRDDHTPGGGRPGAPPVGPPDAPVDGGGQTPIHVRGDTLAGGCACDVGSRQAPDGAAALPGLILLLVAFRRRTRSS